MLYPALRTTRGTRIVTIISEIDVPESPIPRKEITCNGEKITVTANLEAALVHFRHTSGERYMWIDQLCINQEDLEERNQQVSMMGQIYSMAEDMAVWLGQSDQDTPIIWNLFLELGKLRDFHSHEIFDLAVRSDSSDEPGAISAIDINAKVMKMSSRKDRKELPRLPSGTSSCWQAVKRFFDRPWFCRVWTFHEVVMGKRCMVWCGEFYLSWALLQDACQGIDMAGYARSADFLLHNVTSRFERGNRYSLRYLLEANRTRDAIEPRNKVYALRGLVGQRFSQAIDVEYEKSLGLVYAKAARTCIEAEQSLTVLGYVEYRRTDESRDEMLSWVPDWRFRTSVQADLSMRRPDQSKYFNASGDNTPSLIPSVEKKLVLKGFSVATLTRFHDVRRSLEFTDHMGSGRFAPQRFELDSWKSMYRAGSSTIYFSPGSIKNSEYADNITASIWSKSTADSLTDEETIEMAYRRTLTADLMPRPKSRLRENELWLFPAYVSWRNSGFQGPVPVEVLHEHDYFMTLVMTNGVFFVADDGDSSYMGIVMGVTAVGDQVCILLGGDTPFVLRPLGNGEWQFIAETYAHGIMDGEAMSRTREADF